MYGIHYRDTFSPVTKLIFIRLLISFATIHHLPLYQLDIKNAFLHCILMMKFIWSNHMILLLERSLDKFVVSENPYIG